MSSGAAQVARASFTQVPWASFTQVARASFSRRLFQGPRGLIKKLDVLFTEGNRTVKLFAHILETLGPFPLKRAAPGASAANREGRAPGAPRAVRGGHRPLPWPVTMLGAGIRHGFTLSVSEVGV